MSESKKPRLWLLSGLVQRHYSSNVTVYAGVKSAVTKEEALGAFILEVDKTFPRAAGHTFTVTAGPDAITEDLIRVGVAYYDDLKEQESA